MSHDIEVITYGGGDILWSVFNAIAMLFYGGKEGNFVQPLCVISASIGGSLAISRFFFQSYTEMFFTKYLLPLLAIPTLMLIPQTEIHIIDRIDDKARKVEQVPYLFAKVIGLTNFWGYQMTEGIENVMHTPNDVQYAKTGMLFGAETSLDFSRLRLNDANMAQNLRHFTQQCIIYDIALGRYTMDNIRKSSDILAFLKENTSKVRMIPYTGSGESKSDLLTCVESVDRMEPMFKKEADYYLKHEILKKLPITYQALMGLQTQSKEKIAEQIVTVNGFSDAMARFAKERAKDNQRSIYQTAGSLAGSSLVTMRIVLEALIYASCALILPLSLLPGGIRFLSSWVFLNVWIQLWPPLYGILNYITVLGAQKYANSIMEGANGFSIFTSVGFQDLALDTSVLGGYLTLSVPIISFYLLQNLNSLVHVTGSLMTPAHSAATTAAGELSTGNYSFANTSMGQTSYDNQTSFQQNSAPSLSTGYFTDNYGTHQVKYGRERLAVNQDASNLITSISTAEAYTSSLQNAMQNAQSRVDTTQGVYSETRGVAERSAADLVQHIATADSLSSGYSSSEVLATQESANWVMNAAQNWGHSTGLSARESLEYFASLGLDVSFIGSAKIGHGQNIGAVSDEARQKAESIVQSQDFQEHYQRVLNSTQNTASNMLSDEGRRYVESYASSTEKLKSSQDQLTNAFSELNQISESLNYVESHTSSVNTNLNTEFSNWLHEKGSFGALFDTNREQELNCLRDAFIEEKCHSQLGGLQSYQDPLSLIGSLPKIDSSWTGQGTMRQSASDVGLVFGQVAKSGEGISRNHGEQSERISHKFSAQQQTVTSTHQGLENDYIRENNQSNIGRLNTRCAEHASAAFCDKLTWFDEYASPN